MPSSLHTETFKKGSKTYFNSTRFFPRDVREDVFILYGFVRIADNLVDAIPQDRRGFREFEELYRKALGGSTTGNIIVDDYIELAKRRDFDPAWTEAFFESMRMDIEKTRYVDVSETLHYVYGSAEVIGLFMARIMGLDRAADHAARMLGRSMQFINFIRDVAEDNRLGRTYLPLSETPLQSLQESEARKHPDEFVRFIRSQIERYAVWQREAEQGYQYIPKRYLVPIKTAADMYNWTAERIAEDPLLVFKKKVKPAKLRIVMRGLRNRFTRMSDLIPSSDVQSTEQQAAS